MMDDNSQQQFEQDQEFQLKVAYIQSHLDQGGLEVEFFSYLTEINDGTDQFANNVIDGGYEKEFCINMVERELAKDKDFNEFVRQHEGIMQ